MLPRSALTLCGLPPRRSEFYLGTSVLGHSLSDADATMNFTRLSIENSAPSRTPHRERPGAACVRFGQFLAWMATTYGMEDDIAEGASSDEDDEVDLGEDKDVLQEMLNQVSLDSAGTGASRFSCSPLY